jgi:hypothetical protein
MDELRIQEGGKGRKVDRHNDIQTFTHLKFDVSLGRACELNSSSSGSTITFYLLWRHQ